MSLVDRRGPRVVPPLVAGERLDQPTFHERYAAMPEGTWAELVGGVVYMPSPLRDEHGETDDSVSFWLVSYRRSTPGLRSGSSITTVLGLHGEVQPDRQLRIPEERGGRTRVVEGFIHGPPDLVVEVARSSKTYDLGAKKADYEQAGVPEYVVVELDPDRVRWFVRRGDRFVEMTPGLDGIFRSEVFPGLWLDPAALFDEDFERLIEVLEQGRATPEHAAFVAGLSGGGQP